MPFRARTYIGSAGDVLVVEQHAARVRAGQADDHAERRRLARAVRAEQADDFARRHVEVDVAHDGAAAVGLGQPSVRSVAIYLAAGLGQGMDRRGAPPAAF